MIGRLSIILSVAWMRLWYWQFCSPAGLAAAQSSTTVLLNGKILTVDPKFSTAEALAIRDGRIVAAGTSADLRKMAGPQARCDRSGGTHRNPGLDRFAHARHPRRAQLQHRSELDRRAIARRSAGPNPPGISQHAAGRMADRGGRLERPAVLGESAAHAGGTGGRRAGKSRVRSVGLRLGDPDAEGAG